MPPYNIQKPGDSLKLENINNMEGDDGLRSNLSHQELITDPEVIVVTSNNGDQEVEEEQQPRRVTKTQVITVAVLCYVNLINYMDRFTIAGILINIQHTFSINDSLIPVIPVYSN
ncbi:protein spinster homolog 3-like isoform X2 [Homarus americanus]|uniref:protein spinster homolog 3-like isoform X2 n=1 Tax=Homarus americanus TaxID=6706 RepID=UPI001C449F3A|nr:protein spinster homolog 3-like isoform X2 [Homarus americanus]